MGEAYAADRTNGYCLRPDLPVGISKYSNRMLLSLRLGETRLPWPDYFPYGLYGQVLEQSRALSPHTTGKMVTIKFRHESAWQDDEIEEALTRHLSALRLLRCQALKFEGGSIINRLLVVSTLTSLKREITSKSRPVDVARELEVMDLMAFCKQREGQIRNFRSGSRTQWSQLGSLQRIVCRG